MSHHGSKEPLSLGQSQWFHFLAAGGAHESLPVGGRRALLVRSCLDQLEMALAPSFTVSDWACAAHGHTTHTLQYVSSHCITLHLIALHCVSIHYVTFFLLLFIAFHFISLHYITLHTHIYIYIHIHAHTHRYIYIYSHIHMHTHLC